jgi:hypothetical protein
MIGDIIGHVVAILLVLGPVIWAVRRADKLSAERTNALGFKLDTFLASLDAARSERVMRLSALPGIIAPPPPRSGARLASPKPPEIDEDQRETYYGGKP